MINGLIVSVINNKFGIKFTINAKILIFKD